MEPDIIIYAIVAVALVLWLRNVLGTRHGDERSRPNPFAAPPPGLDEASRAVPARLLPGDRQLIDAASIQQGLERHMSVAPAAESAMTDIARADRDFTAPHFLRGAQDAFVMIVEAFAHGDRATLRDLLSDPVYAAFSSALDQREKDGRKASVEVHAIRRAEITAARLEGRMASISVKFVSDQTNVLRDAQDAVLQGHPDRVSETIDVWTFARDLRSNSPAWLVTDTREEGPEAAILPVSA